LGWPSGIDDPAAAPAINVGQDEQSGYGLRCDQHSAHERGRPIAWIVVAVIIAGTFISGISLIVAAPSLFWTGAAVVIVGVIIGRATHAMRDVADRDERLKS
jgi:hypothetical protein